MNGMEALTRLIYLSDCEIARKKAIINEDQVPSLDRDIEQDELSVAVGTAILNNGLPIARFRIHVTVDTIQPAKRGREQVDIREEFTVCGVSVQAVRQGILALTTVDAAVQVSLWEQRATGADMVSAFQGRTKTIHYRSWLKQILAFNAPQQKTEIPQAPLLQ